MSQKTLTFMMTFSTLLVFHIFMMAIKIVDYSIYFLYFDFMYSVFYSFFTNREKKIEQN